MHENKRHKNVRVSQCGQNADIIWTKRNSKDKYITAFSLRDNLFLII